MSICKRLLQIKNLKISYSLRTMSKRVLSTTSNPLILGIETSCDDTGVAIVDGKGSVISETLVSQNNIHLRFGGVNPLVAEELHRNNIDNAVEDTLKRAHLTIKEIDAIAVTTKPGLLVSLMVGVKYAKYFARKYKKSLIPIHHMEAHALVARMNHDIPFPFIVLLISGGHSLLGIANDVDDFMLLGETSDNAPGEVLDKVARRMKLRNIPEYAKMSGGQAVEEAAKKSKNVDLFQFTMPLRRYRDCNFSFSGLKASLEKKLLEKESEHNIIGDGVIPEYCDLCASFQLAIAEHIALRTKRAIVYCEEHKLITNNKNIVISGGVACNNFIFKSINFIGNQMGYNVVRPPPRLCTDNGVMIAWNGLEKYKKHCDIVSDISFSDVEPRSPFKTNLIKEVRAANIPVKVIRLKDIYNK